MGMELDLKRGSYGEAIVRDYFDNNENIRQVISVRADKRYRNEDVDFLIETQDRQFYKVEVKTDYKAQESGNLPFEIVSNKDINSRGCVAKTKADFIVYYLPQSSTMYLLTVRKLKEFLRTNASKLKYVEMGDNAEGFLLKIDELKEKGIIDREEIL